MDDIAPADPGADIADIADILEGALIAESPFVHPPRRVRRRPIDLRIDLRIDLLISRKVPFLGLYPIAKRCLMAFFPAACFLREIIRL